MDKVKLAEFIKQWLKANNVNIYLSHPEYFGVDDSFNLLDLSDAILKEVTNALHNL